MSLYANAIIDSDPERHIQFGVGLVVDVADHIMSPDRAAAERAAIEKEARDLEEAQEAERQEAADELAFWSMLHGEPLQNGPAQVLKAHDEATDRADRREAAKAAAEHSFECGCADCNASRFGTSERPAPPKRPGHIVDAELKASQAEFMAQPATVADVAHLAAETSKLKGALAHLLGKR